MKRAFLGDLVEIQAGLSRRHLQATGGEQVQVICARDWPQDLAAQASASGLACPPTLDARHLLQDGDLLCRHGQAWLLNAPLNLVCAAPLLRLRCKNHQQLAPRYLQWVLNLPSRQHFLRQMMAERGGRLSARAWASLPIPLCCSAKQEQIAHIYGLHLRRQHLQMQAQALDARMLEALLAYVEEDDALLPAPEAVIGTEDCV